MRTLIRNGRMAFDNRVEQADVLLEGGRIAAIGQNQSPAARLGLALQGPASCEQQAPRSLKPEA